MSLEFFIDKIFRPHYGPGVYSASNKNEYKVKESRNRPSVAQGVPGGFGSQIFMTFGT